MAVEDATGPDPEAAPLIEASGDASTGFRLRGFGERYRRGPLIGVGGMGEVRAWTDRATGREVAMKTIRVDRDAPIAVSRFAREARIQAQLEHPSIVPVYELGSDDDDALYFTMKRVRGHSLARVLATAADRNDYSLRKLLTVVVRVAMALEYAHRRGVVNRDLKPANIMLGAFDEVYVIDWGLADLRTRSSWMPSRPDLVLGLPLPPAGLHGPLELTSPPPDTASGQLLGTPGHVAPEQIRDPDGVDHRADVYALGVILFEILAGERLHRGDALAEVIMATLETDGASPAARAPDRQVPPELDALCVQMTRLDPAHRPQRAADVARAIEQYLDGDRDLERRRALANASAERAAAALTRARAAGADETALRTEALREVGRAVVLDPDSPLARATLMRALTEPVRTAPPEAEAAYQASARRRIQLAARNAALGMLTYALYLPLVLWMGVRHGWMLATMGAAIVAVIAVSYYHYRRPPRAIPWLHLAATTAAMVSGHVLFGSLVLLPGIAIITGVSYITTFGRRAIYYAIIAALVVLGPLALQLLGVLAPSYRFAGGELIVVPNLTELPPTPTLVLLTVANLVVVLASLGYVWRLRCDFLDSERRLHVQAWQLAKLVDRAAPPLA